MRHRAVCGSLVLVALLLLGSGVSATRAAELPYLAYGVGLSPGDLVTAWVGTVPCGSSTADAGGQWLIAISPDNCPVVDGATINFSLNGVYVNETATYTPSRTAMNDGYPAASGIPLTPLNLASPAVIPSATQSGGRAGPTLGDRALTVLAFAVAGATLGGVWGVLLLTQTPTLRIAAPLAVVVALTGFVSALLLGRFGDWSIASGLVVGASGLTVTTALRAGLLWRDSQARNPYETVGLLSANDIGRVKRSSDRWFLVLGSAEAGKTSLVDAMTSRPLGGGDAVARLVAPVRSGELTGMRVTELEVELADVELTLRFWEADAVGEHSSSLPPVSAFDGIVFTVDPTQVSALRESFPATMRSPETASSDPETGFLALCRELRNSPRRQPLFWVVLTKCDLLRFSTARPLVDFEVKWGPDWYRQMELMDPVKREELLRAVSLDSLVDSRPEFELGRGTPMVAYSAAAKHGRGSFGGPELLRNIVEPLAYEAGRA